MRALLFAAGLLLASTGVANAQTPDVGEAPDPDLVPGMPDEVLLGIPADRRSLTRAGVDPVTTIPSLGLAPDVAAPALDVLAASLLVSEKGAAIRGVFAPFIFLDEPPPVVADTRVEIRGQSDFGKPWGVSVSTGYNRVTDRLRKQLGESAITRIKDKCQNTPLPPNDKERVEDAANDLAKKLRALNLGARTVPTLQDKEVDRYVRELYVTWQNTKAISQAGKEKEVKEAEVAAKKLYETTGSTLEGSRGECIYKAYALERMTAAYSNGWAIRVEGSVDFFPYIEGPKVSPKEGEPAAEPVKHGIAGFGGAGSLIWFPSRSSRVSATVSYGVKRATPQLDPQRRLGFLLEMAHNYGIGDIDVSGFQRGIAFGGMFAMQRCLEDAGCNDPVPYYDGAMTARTLTVGGFIDVRAAEKLQLRVGLPFTIHTFAAPPARSDGGSLAWSFAPTVALSTTQWTL